MVPLFVVRYLLCMTVNSASMYDALHSWGEQGTRKP